MNAYAAPESDFFNNATFPDLEEDGVLSRHRFSILPLAEADGFRRARILDHVRAGRSGSGLAYAGRCAVELIAGSIPVGEAGLLVARPGAGPAAAYLAERGVEYAGAQLPLVGDYPLQVETGRLLCCRPGAAGRGAGLAAHSGKIPPRTLGRPHSAGGLPGRRRGGGDGDLRRGRPAEAGAQRRRRLAVAHVLPRRPPRGASLPAGRGVAVLERRRGFQRRPIRGEDHRPRQRVGYRAGGRGGLSRRLAHRASGQRPPGRPLGAGRRKPGHGEGEAARPAADDQRPRFLQPARRSRPTWSSPRPARPSSRRR